MFQFILRNNKFNPVPQFIGNQNIEIEYVSPLAKAQKTGEVQSLMRGLELMGTLQNVAPVFDYLDTDNLVAYIKDVLGIPAKIMKSKGEVAQMREERQVQQQQEAAMQEDMQTAEIANKSAPLVKALNE